MSKLLLVLIFILLPHVVMAQATGTSKLLFDQSAPTLAEANSYIYRYYPDTAVLGIPLTTVCIGTTSPFICSAAFPAFTPSSHTLSLTAASSASPTNESGKSVLLSFTFILIPSIPVNPRIG